MIKLLTLRSFMCLGGALGLVTHVQKGLEGIGEKSIVYKIAKRTEDVTRDFQGVHYMNITVDDFAKVPGETFIFEPKCDNGSDRGIFSWGMELYRKGKATMFVHDVYDTRNDELMESIQTLEGRGVFCARPAVLAVMPQAKRVLLPYTRRTQKRSEWAARPNHAAFMSRVSSEKRFNMVVQANEYLSKKHKVDFLGQPNRLHVHHAIKRYPALESLLGYKGYRMDEGVKILNRYKFAIDVTRYPTEYSFVQYVTLEALEAGAIPVLDAVAAEGTLVNEDAAIYVNSPIEIVAAMQREFTRAHVRKMWKDFDTILDAHDSREFAKLLINSHTAN